MAVNINDGVLLYIEATRGEHNGHGSKEFLRLNKLRLLPQDGFVRVTIQGMADYFGVHRHTMGDWITRYNKKHAPDNDRFTI